MARRQRESKPEDGIIAERRIQALDLRKGGASFRAIGKQLNISYEQARMDVEAVLTALAARSQELAAEHRQLELERLDRLLLAVWSSATKGDTAAVTAALKISDRRAKLLGLDAPVKQELSGRGGSPIQSLNVNVEANNADQAASILDILARAGAIPTGAFTGDNSETE